MFAALSRRGLPEDQGGTSYVEIGALPGPVAALPAAAGICVLPQRPACGSANLLDLGEIGGGADSGHTGPWRDVSVGVCMEMPAAGWYEDPVAAGGPLRWWDGTQWTEHTAPAARPPRPATENAPHALAGSVPLLPAPVDPPAPRTPPAPPAPPAPSGDPSLTDWFDSIPFPVVGRGEMTVPDPATRPAGLEPQRAAENSTRVLERAASGALAGFGWEHSAPVTGADTPLLERGEPAGMLRRNRTRLMWGVALGAALAMLITGVLVAVFGSAPAPRTTPAAAGHPSAAGTPSPEATATPATTAGPAAAAATGTPVTDAASGLSYALLAAPWTAGCPATMNNAVFTWTAGESAVAGTVPPAGGAPWYGSACSGLLGPQYAYTSVADLPQTAMNLASAFDPAYFGALPHARTTEQNNPLQISGNPGWIVEFAMTYPAAASQGLPWQTQLGAVVVVDRGAGQPPAVLYVTAPDNLGTAIVGRILASLALAAPGSPAAPASPPPPAVPAPPATQAAAPAVTGAAPNPPNP